jgi:Na+/proline symporter
MRLIGVVAFLVQTALYLGIVIYAPALALSKTTGLNLWGVVVGTGIVCIIYTTLGGMKAVIWTGVFQALVMFGGFFAIIIFGCYEMGWGEIWRINQEEHRLDIWDFSTDIRQKHTFWTILFAGQMVWLSLYATSQAQVQRYMSSKTLKDAQLAIGINVVGLWFINAAALACGMVIFGKREELDK